MTASYTSDDPVERLAAVRASINRCLQAQQFSQRGRLMMQAQLSSLREMEKDLMQEVADSANGANPVSLARFSEPS